MAHTAYPSKYFVPALPPQYVGDLGDESNTTEALLLRLLLQSDPSTSPAPAVVVKGLGGTGKTTALMAVGNHHQTWEQFPEAVWFIRLGQHGKPSTLIENLETVVRDVVGASQADKVAELAKSQDKSSAVAEAIRLLNDHAVLILADDVWADERSPEVGQSTVFSLVQECVRRVRGNPGDLRLIFSTRDASVATLAPGRCRVVAKAFEAREMSAKAMLCSYAEIGLDEIEIASSVVQESFRAVLDSCAGLQLALAIAGSGILSRTESGGVTMDAVWCLYAAELVETAELLKTPHPDHSAIYAMLESSLKHLAACLRKDGIVLSDGVRVVFNLIGIVKKQEWVPLSVVGCLWGMSQTETLHLCRAFERLHILSLEYRDGVWWISGHDLILDYCKTVLEETPGRWSFAHRMIVEGLERMLLGEERLKESWGGCAAFWKLGDGGYDMVRAAGEHCVQNIARHQTEAGGEYMQRLLCLLTDYRWVEYRMRQSKDGNDLGGYDEDLETLLVGCGNEAPEKVKEGLEGLSDAARLSMQYVGSNPRELAFQLHARLWAGAMGNAVVDRFLWTLRKYAKRPWLKAGTGMLKAAGGAVVLSASLPKALFCVAVLPNGEDVVIGGDDGYLAVFNIRYASESYELGGHRGTVHGVAVCAASQKIFSCGGDGTVRAWALETAQGPGQVLVRHERQVLSLAVTADGSRVVFGDRDGWLTVCDATSGDVICQWLGHSALVRSLAVRADGMIVSGLRDGTVGRWAYDGGRQVGMRTAVGSERVFSVVVSRDGRRIAYGADEKVGVVDADSGDVVRECRTDFIANCVTFGPDEETLHFGTNDGTTAALSPDGLVVSDVTAHSSYVSGIAQCRDSRLVVSVSYDRTLSVQKIDRLDSSPAAVPEIRFKVRQFVVLPDRKRVLYSWQKGPGGLKLLDLGTTSPEAALSEQALVEASATIGSADFGITAIAASRDGRWAVAGTTDGEVVVYDTDNWRPRHASLRCLRGAVWSTASSNDGAFLAAGSDGGDVALFRLEDGSEVPLPSSAAVDGEVLKVAFSEESSNLLAAVRNLSQATGMLHVWKHIDQAADVEHVALPFSRIASWNQPPYRMSLIATISHIATRHTSDSEACIWGFTDDQKCWASTEDEDESGLLRLSNREHGAFELEGALFMEPFGQAIRYRHGSGSEVLGTMEAPISQSFRPEQWTFNARSNVFMAGGYLSNLLSAVLVEEDTRPENGDHDEEPKLPPIHKAAAAQIGIIQSGTDSSQYTAFISHAGPDKLDIAIPLYRRLMEKGIETFVDKEGLRHGDVGVQEMEAAMGTADVGVFITSPEFVCREWPMRKLSCFLSRREEAESSGEKPPVVLPLFYRLNVHECRRSDLFNMSRVNQAAIREGFYSAERQEEMPIGKVLDLMKGLANFTGIENEESVVNDDMCISGRLENQMRRQELIERIVKAIVEARARRDVAAEREARRRREQEAEQVELIPDAEVGQDEVNGEGSGYCSRCVIA